MSYPKNRKVKIDISTFPTNTVFTSLTVETILEYIFSFDGEDVIDEETIANISS